MFATWMLVALAVTTPVFHPVDLGAVLNSDPRARQDIFDAGIVSEPPYCLWREGEACDRMGGDASATAGREDLPGASGAAVLGKGFGAHAGDWAEWCFDLPWQSETGTLYVRVARPAGAPEQTFSVMLNGRSAGTLSLAATAASTDTAPSFGTAYAIAPIGPLHVGRQMLRLVADAPGPAVELDGFWVADGEQSFDYTLDASGHLAVPPTSRMIVYTPGHVEAGGVTFELADPAAHNGKGVCVAGPDAPLAIACGGQRAAQVHLLVGGGLGPVKGQAVLRYADGTQSETSIEIGPLFSTSTKDAPITFGSQRRGYIVTLPAQNKALKEVEIDKIDGKYVVLAVTLESSAPEKKAGKKK